MLNSGISFLFIFSISHHEDIIQEVVDGRNSNPSAQLLQRSINLHRLIRCDLYRSIIKKIAVILFNRDLLK